MGDRPLPECQRMGYTEAMAGGDTRGYMSHGPNALNSRRVMQGSYRVLVNGLPGLGCIMISFDPSSYGLKACQKRTILLPSTAHIIE